MLAARGPAARCHFISQMATRSRNGDTAAAFVAVSRSLQGAVLGRNVRPARGARIRSRPFRCFCATASIESPQAVRWLPPVRSTLPRRARRSRGPHSPSSLCVLGEFACIIVSRRVIRRIGVSVAYDLRKRVYDHLQHQGPGFFARHPTGDLMARAINDINLVRQLVGMGLRTILVIVFSAVVGLVLHARARADVDAAVAVAAAGRCCCSAGGSRGAYMSNRCSVQEGLRVAVGAGAGKSERHPHGAGAGAGGSTRSNASMR